MKKLLRWWTIKTLTKEERKKIKKEFLNSKEAIIYKKAHRILIIGIIGVLFAILATIFDVLYETGFWNYSLDGILFIFSLIFIFKTKKLKDNVFNKYLTRQKNT